MDVRQLILDVLIQHLPVGGEQTERLYAIADQIAERIDPLLAPVNAES
jgi:hypothetical protein